MAGALQERKVHSGHISSLSDVQVQSLRASWRDQTTGWDRCQSHSLAGLDRQTKLVEPARRPAAAALSEYLWDHVVGRATGYHAEISGPWCHHNRYAEELQAERTRAHKRCLSKGKDRQGVPVKGTIQPAMERLLEVNIGCLTHRPQQAWQVRDVPAS